MRNPRQPARLGQPATSGTPSLRHLPTSFDEYWLPRPCATARLRQIDAAWKLSVLNRGKNVELARLAAEAGFADQSHMTRHIKRETGFTPDQLRARIDTDEAFWCYRL